MKYLQLILISILISTSLSAQIRGTGEIVKQERQVGTFNQIKISGAQDVILMNGDQYSVVIETNENLLEHIKVVIQDDMLWIEYKNIKRYDKMKFYVTAPVYNRIKVSGASDVQTVDTITGDYLKVSAEGASDVRLTLAYSGLDSRASGASDITLGGHAEDHTIKASGASEVIAKELKTKTTSISGSGASLIFVDATDNLTYEVSGASTVKYVGKPETVIISDKKGTNNVVIIKDNDYQKSVTQYADTTTVKFGGLEVEVVEGDTTKVSVGNHMIIVDDDGNVKYRRKNKRFNGHWGGFEMGINGYVTPEFNTSWGCEYDYLLQKYERSWQVNLNIYEQNISLNKDKNMGIVTGIGMAWNNWFFNNPTYLKPGGSELEGYYMEGVSVRKTKLTAWYITVPLMYEIQTKNPRRIKRFHFGIGALMSVRVRSHTKIYFDQANQEYWLTETCKPYDTVEGPYITPSATSRNIIKSYNSFQMQPIRFDAMVRIGYGIINLWGHFGLNQMFQSGRGPELYTWAAGITIVGW